MSRRAIKSHNKQKRRLRVIDHEERSLMALNRLMARAAPRAARETRDALERFRGEIAASITGTPLRRRQRPALCAIPPGEILLEDWMKPNGLSGNELSRRTGIPASRLTEIIKGRRSITADTALRLGRFFGTGERFWLNIQQARHIELARAARGPVLKRDIEPLVA